MLGLYGRSASKEFIREKKVLGSPGPFAVEDDCLLLRRQVDIVDDTVDVVVERLYQRVFSA